MAVIPEIVLQKAIVGGIQALRSDPRLIDVLFKNLSQTYLNQLKTYILSARIDFCNNYPRQGQLNLPAIVLILRGEAEAETFLGDHMGTSPFMDTPDPDMVINTTGGHGGSISDLPGLPPALVQGLQVEESVGAEVVIHEDSLEEYRAVYLSMVEGNSYKLYVTQGTGVGQIADIISVTDNSLDIEPAYDVILDSSSRVDIRKVATTYTEGEPSRVYESTGTYERLGVHYETQYQIQILTGKQEETVHLYSIVKALLLSQRPFLEGQGLLVFKLSGSDFAPRGDYLPTDAFMRVLNIEFTYPFSIIKELDVAKQIQVELQPDDLGSVGSGPHILIGSFTIE